MFRRSSVPAWVYGLSFCVLTALAAFAQAAPTLVSAVSRMTHGATPYDLPLPLTAPGGIECRNTAPGVKVVLTFSTNVVSGTAAIAGGTATVNGAPTFSGQTMTVNLTGVTDALSYTLTVSNVSDGSTSLPSAAVTFRVLYGDVNSSGSVTVTDLALVKSKELQTTNGANYRCDVNFSGSISITDTAIVQSRMGKSVAGGAGVNTVPTITNITDQSTAISTATAAIPFTVGDAQSDPAALYVWATSSDTSVAAASGLVLGGSGASRTLTITPVTGVAGMSLISVFVSDGIVTTTDTFILTVGTPNKLYYTTMGIAAGVTNSNAYGTTSMVVNGTETQGTVKLNFANMTSARTAARIQHQSGEVLFDIAAAAVQPDGSYLWTFAPTASYTVPQIVSAIKNGQTYVYICSANNAGGELTGQIKLVTGSTTFTPPASPPALPGGTPTDADACRWLVQATFGPQPDDTAGSIDTINQVKALGFNEWFDRHTNPSNANYVGATTSLLSLLQARTADASLQYAFGGSQITEGWWKIALTSNDQLRQRVAFAYSQIFVVSRQEDAIDGQPAGLASWHDMLANDAFVNFRTLLKDVTLHPIMGQYLNMRGNTKQANASSPLPNENYAREILQLFSIGLSQLHPDGTLKLDADGLPIATYTQTTIEQFAKVFTGWRENSVPDTYQAWDTTTSALIATKSYYIKPMVLRTSGNDAGFTPSAGNHDFTQKALLNNYVIAATSTTTVAKAEAELDAAIDNIFMHPNTGPFICRQLIQRLVTSDPSPAYVYRVARVFADNGTGVRGDMKAVIKAILTDYEARSTAYLGNQGYGRIKEPVVRIAQVARALHPYSTAGTGPTAFWRIPDTTTELDQTVYRATTVFNFYVPEFKSAIDLNNPNNAAQKYQEILVTPENQITTENTNVYYARLMRRAVVENGGFIPTTTGGSSDVRVNITTETNAVATSADTMLDYSNRLMMAGQMSTSMRTLVKNYMATITTGGTDMNPRKVRAALYLITTSPQFTIQK